MKLNFKISNLDTIPTKKKFKKNHLDYLDFINIEGDFEFFIDDVLILKEGAWNIGELAIQLFEWVKNEMVYDFHYNCMDSENSIFNFSKNNESYTFYSDWSVNQANRKIDKETLKEFITSYVDATIKRINEDLKYNTIDFFEKNNYR